MPITHSNGVSSRQLDILVQSSKKRSGLKISFSKSLAYHSGLRSGQRN